VAFGSVDSYVEQVRDRRLGRWAGELAQDGRYALRLLRKSPTFTFVVVSTLALCLGANATSFSVLHSVLLRPFPYPEAERVVNVGMVWPRWQWGDMVQEISPLSFLEIQESAGSFSALGFIDASGRGDLHRHDGVLRLNVASVTPSVWSVTRVNPAIGRVFDDGDLASGQTRLAVLSHELWRDSFGASPAVVGRTLQLDDAVYEIVGVMPAGFSLASNQSRLWIPRVFSAEERSENGRGNAAFQAIGRLRDGVSVAQARHELEALHAGFVATHPEAREFVETTGQTYGVAPLSIWVGDRASGSLLVSLQIAAALVLLLGCLNVAGLLIVRGHGRFHEMALRGALGASPRRIAQQLTVETLVLFLSGGVAGALVAAAVLRFLPAHFRLSEVMPYGQQVGFDGRLLAATIGASLLTGLLAGSLPILSATRRDLRGLLQALSLHTTGSRHRRWTQSAFVAGQIALSLVLLTGAIITGRNLRGLLDQGFGVTTENRLVASVALPEYRFGHGFAANQERINPFKEQALERIRSLPGVARASVSNRVPLSRDWPQKFGFRVPGREPAPNETPAIAFAYEVHPGFFQTLGVPLLRGRDFEPTDDADSPPVVVVSSAIARRYFEEGRALGERIQLFERDCEIIGVVGETQNVPLSLGNAPALYLSATQWPAFNDEAAFVVQTAVPPDTMAAAITGALKAIDPMLSVRVTSLARMQRTAIVTQSAPMEIAGLFAILAVLLTALGLYGVLASSVAHRTRDLAIRIALGAQRRAVSRMVLVQGGFLTLAGTLVGALAAWPMLRWIEPLLATADTARGYAPVLAAGLILVVTLVASYLPARRASRVDPVVALRNE
jgi:predicted permease